MIRSTSHSLKFTNTGKLSSLNSFIDEYRRVAGVILDDIWKNGYKWEIENKQTNQIIKCEFNVEQNLLNHPSFIDYNRFIVDTTLSARALSSLVTQLCGVIGASVEKQRKRWFMYEQQCTSGHFNEQLYKKIKQNIPQKPDISNLNAELSSKCIDWQDSDTSFDGYLRLKSIGTTLGSITLPVKFHQLNKKYQDWERLNSFLIGKDFINIRWKKESPILKTEGVIIGADQGIKTCLSLSDKQITSTNTHGYDLDKILDTLIRKRKGSKGFKRGQAHRKNYINWSINQLNFSNIKQLNFENIWNIGYKNPRNRKLASWTNTLIRDKLEDRCTLLGVQVVHQSSTYRSQRCSGCGLVRKSNRKGKEYSCSNCGLVIDADYNAALNHEISLPDIPLKLRKLNLNREGFFWKELGFYDLSSKEIRVPYGPESKSYNTFV